MVVCSCADSGVVEGEACSRLAELPPLPLSLEFCHTSQRQDLHHCRSAQQPQENHGPQHRHCRLVPLLDMVLEDENDRPRGIHQCPSTYICIKGGDVTYLKQKMTRTVQSNRSCSPNPSRTVHQDAGKCHQTEQLVWGTV